VEGPGLLVWLLVWVLIAVGLAGSILPFLPGTPLIFAGALVYAFATGWHPIGGGRLLILAALAALSWALAHVAGALGARRFGGTRWGVIGALVGAVVGIFLGPVGLLAGPFVGAIAGELLRGADVPAGVRSGVGALVGMLLGAAATVGFAVLMVSLFVWWVWRG
jgi:uncharacterized protein YqgC (DUF456 family)